ncbi:contact-dependent growth inhibition system immunity protein [Amycolatopsis sp. NPDC023774]
MDAEDLRVLLLQQENIDVLVPVALTRLEQNPLAEGDLYPGDRSQRF